MQADDSDTTGPGGRAANISSEIIGNDRSQNDGAERTRVRPRGGKLILDPKGKVALDFDGDRWMRDWFGQVGVMGGRHIGKLILCFSRRVRSAERLRLLRELRAAPGAAGAVFTAYCRNLARQEWRIEELERAQA